MWTSLHFWHFKCMFPLKWTCTYKYSRALPCSDPSGSHSSASSRNKCFLSIFLTTKLVYVQKHRPCLLNWFFTATGTKVMTRETLSTFDQLLVLVSGNRTELFCFDHPQVSQKRFQQINGTLWLYKKEVEQDLKPVNHSLSPWWVVSVPQRVLPPPWIIASECGSRL